MNWYDLLAASPEKDDPPYYISGTGSLGSLKPWHFRLGVPIERTIINAWIRSDSKSEDGPPDDGLANHFGLLIFSEKMRRVLDDGGVSGIQYIPIEVLKSDGTQYPGFAIANLINCPSALDWKSSEFSLFSDDETEPGEMNQISSLLTPVLKAGSLGGLHIVRLKEFTPAVFVSQHFVDLYNHSGLTGYSFRRVRSV
jgi:hypothetical protein